MHAFSIAAPQTRKFDFRVIDSGNIAATRNNQLSTITFTISSTRFVILCRLNPILASVVNDFSHLGNTTYLGKVQYFRLSHRTNFKHRCQWILEMV